MFKNVQFLFIGKFKGYKHVNLKQMVHDHGGTTVVNCSGNTNYVILPNDLGSGEKYANNQQIAIAQKKGKPIVHLSFLLDCMNQKKIVPFQDHLVEEFKTSVSGDDVGQPAEYGPGFTAGYAGPDYYPMSTPYPAAQHLGFGFPKDFKVWKEYTHSDGRKYYFNILTGLTQWDKPPQYAQQAITTEEELRSQTAMVQQYQTMLQQYSTQYHQMVQQHSQGMPVANPIQGRLPPGDPSAPGAQRPPVRGQQMMGGHPPSKPSHVGMQPVPHMGMHPGHMRRPQEGMSRMMPNRGMYQQQAGMPMQMPQTQPQVQPQTQPQPQPQPQLQPQPQPQPRLGPPQIPTLPVCQPFPQMGVKRERAPGDQQDIDEPPVKRQKLE